MTDSKEIEIPLFKVFMADNVSEEISKTLTSGYITQGKQVEKFERKLREYFNHPYLLTLNSATSGLTLALRLLNLPLGSEILCTPLTCTATNWPVLANGHHIKWVDADYNTCNMSIENLKQKISEKTAAILFVHWGGTPINLSEMIKIQKEAERKYNKKIPIIEDCAHAFGAEYENKKLGLHGNIAIYSFQAIKHLTTGDGGLIVLPDQKMYDRAKKLRWFGIDREKRSLPGKDFRLEEDIPEWGYKFHMNDINATIGLCNFEYIDDILVKCRNNADYYDEKLKNVIGVELIETSSIGSLRSSVGSLRSPWIYSLRVHNKKSFIEFMEKRRIVVSQVHNRNDIHSCVKRYKTELPILNQLEKELICIPVGWWLTKENIEYIVNSIVEWSQTEYNISNLAITDKQEYISLMSQLYGNVNKNDIFENLPFKDIYCVKKDNKLIATAKLLIEPKLYDNMGHIEDVVVDEKYRGNGYGKLLVRYLIKRSEELGCYKTVLNCNEKLIEFYERCGMNAVGYQMVHRNGDRTIKILKESKNKLPSINYVIATYSGPIPSRIGDGKEDEVLQKNLESLLHILREKKQKEIPNLINQITIVCPKLPANVQPYKKYYQRDKWEKIFREFSDVKLVYLEYKGENQDSSYDQWLQGYTNFSNFDYYIFIEDDYVLNTKNVNFDIQLIKLYRKKFSENIGYLCSKAGKGTNPHFHAMISNGIISRKSLDIFDNVLEEYYNYSKKIHCQVRFSLLFTDKDIQIKDYSDVYEVKFWDSGEKKIFDYSSCTNSMSIFVPVQCI